MVVCISCVVSFLVGVCIKDMLKNLCNYKRQDKDYLYEGMSPNDSTKVAIAVALAIFSLLCVAWVGLIYAEGRKKQKTKKT